MIAAPRVLFVTRRFWPLANDNMWRMLGLAGALQSAGWQPQVLTARWHSAWPEQVELRDLRVHRLSPSPSTPFRSRKFGRNVCDWVARHEGLFDCVVIDAVEEDALVLTARQAVDSPPVILRYDTVESGGPLMERVHQRVVAACRQAAQVVVPHEHARRELVAAGVPVGKISIVADGPFPKIQRDEATRGAARRALAEINYELFLRGDDRLCICPCEVVKQAGLDLLIRAIGPLLESRRDARCWIIGEGPDRSRLAELLRHEGWKNDILLPGTFEDIEVLLQAADLCILPGASQGLSWLLPTAVSNGLTTFLCDSPAARSRLGASPLVFEQGNTMQLREKVEAWLEQPCAWRQATSEAAQHLLKSAPVVDQWRELVANFERLRRM
jgi:glycosyltransferase involved in cell wall biosynthesis